MAWKGDSLKGTLTTKKTNTVFNWDTDKIKIGDRFLVSNRRINGLPAATLCEVVDVDCYEIILVYHEGDDSHRLIFLEPSDEQYLS